MADGNMIWPFDLRPNLRLRVALAFSASCIFFVGVLGLMLFTASTQLDDALVEDLVESEMDHLVRRYRDNPDLPPPSGSLIKTYVARDPAGQSRLPPVLQRLESGQHDVFSGKREFQVAVRDVGTARLYVMYDVGLHERRLRDFGLLLLLALVSIAAVSLWLGYWIAGLLVNQVTELAHRVNRLEPGAPAGPMVRAGQDEEVALLARAFDNYQERIHSMLLREQEFTANASHELRTPLTAIRTSCELLSADDSLGERARGRVAAIGAAAERMTEQIKALLFLAREQELGTIETVPLAACVTDAAGAFRAEMERKGLALETDVPPDAALDANPRALNLVLANLIRNAVQYTERGFVRITYRAHRLTVADSGTGFDPVHVPRLFERFYRAGNSGAGFGLGLAIVKRVCDHYGWRIEVSSDPGTGSAFTVVFP